MNDSSRNLARQMISETSLHHFVILERRFFGFCFLFQKTSTEQMVHVKYLKCHQFRVDKNR